MSGRLPRLTPAAMTGLQRALYDEILGGPRGDGPQLFETVGADGALNGPFNAMVLSPSVGAALQALGVAVRYRTSLSDRSREAAILAVAAHWQSAFELYAHMPLGRAAGLTEDEVTALVQMQPWPGDDPVEAAVVGTVRALLARQDLTDDEYAAAVGAVGEPGLVELLTLVGYYAALALQLRVARVPAPD